MTYYKEKSYWLSTIDHQPSEPLRGTHSADIVVIGGGYTGLSVAYHLKMFDPSLDVTLIESDVIGYGASGRNAGFVMTLFGFTLALTRFRFGKNSAKEAHHYMERAVDYTREFIEEHSLDCDFEFPGFLRVATSPALADDIQKELEFGNTIGLEGREWIDRVALYQRIQSEVFHGALFEQRCGLMHPVKYAFELKRLCEEMNVKIFEQTPATEVQLKPSVSVTTPEGIINAEKVMFATNAYSILFPSLKRKQIPVTTHIVLSRPLIDDELKPIGWEGREGIEDSRNLVHYFRLTKDNRLLMGGGNVGIPYGKEIDPDPDTEIVKQLKQRVAVLFPHLSKIEFTNTWSGPVSVPVDLAPAMGYIGDQRAVYSLGCVGHGVSMTLLNGKTAAELLLGKKSDITDTFFVNRKVIPWPPEPLRNIIAKSVCGFFKLEDRIYERTLKRK